MRCNACVNREAWIVKRFLGFILVARGLLATFFIELSLVQGRGQIELTAIKVLYNVLFVASFVVLLINFCEPVFKSSMLSRSPAVWVVVVVVVVDVLVFQLIAVLGLGDDPKFQDVYQANFILLQMINLLFLWACICALVGQDRFHPFFRDVMRNPLGALGYWLGFGATQVGRPKKPRTKPRA